MNLFKKKLTEASLAYWEESSYMLLLQDEKEENPLEGIFERVGKIKDLKILEARQLTATDPGYMKLLYKNDEFEVRFFPSKFSFAPQYIIKNYSFKDEEIEKLVESNKALVIYMKFNEDAKKSFHLQLKLAIAIMPNLIGVMDESAEKIFPPSWVKMATSTDIYPSSNDLYTVQAVKREDGNVWLHTHGLCRCGLTELEILESDIDNYNNHYNLIAAFASFLLDKKKNINLPEKGAYLGLLKDGTPILATYRSWIQGLNEYKKLTLENANDRKDGHNSKTSVIFLYQSEEDEQSQTVSKVSIYNDLWGENPIFFYSDEETFRMKALAIERFSYVKEAFSNRENKILIKIGLKTKTNDDNQLEHIWFELLEIKENELKGRLTQEPYDVENMHEGDEAWYKIEEITDWIIYTKECSINPQTVYILD